MSDSQNISVQPEQAENEGAKLLQKSNEHAPPQLSSRGVWRRWTYKLKFNRQFNIRKRKSTHAAAFFRSFGLQIVNIFSPWRRGSERRKVAIQQDRFLAL